MSISSGVLASFTSGISTASSLTNLLLVSPNNNYGYQPNNPSNSSNLGGASLSSPPAFLFHFEGEQSVQLISDITDHFIEDNTAIQDQIALKPVEVSTQGFIGELNDVVPTLLQPLFKATQALTTISAYTPKLSIAAQLAFNEAFQLYQVAQSAINSATSAISSITGGNAIQNKQQQAFTQFYGWWSTLTLFTIQTPWCLFENMAIKTLRPIQSAETNVITTFEITFKQMRFASTAFAGSQSSQSQGRLIPQSSSKTDQGFSTPPQDIALDTGLSQSYPGMFS